jgi:hypothetical protein
LKNLFNKIFGISQRCTGKVDEDGLVTDLEIFSYDIVSDPGFPIDFSDTFELTERIRRELERQELLKNRKEKLNKLNNIE